MDMEQTVKKLKEKGVVFTNGMMENEIIEIEELYNVKFPPDLKEFFKFALPISEGFLNWNDKSKININRINNRFLEPLEGIIFDIEHNEFWMQGWGEKPSDIREAVKLATMYFNNAPKLIPIWYHRYIPSTPSEYGNPIMSVHQTDIIYYGENLLSYLLVEFGFKKREDIDFDNIKEIPFWSEIINS